MKQFFVGLLVVFLSMVSVVAEEYNIELSTTPEQITARDNPFAHYDDLGDLPSLTVTVKDSTGRLADDVTIQMTVTHVDNLLLPTGFPWVEGKELFSIKNFAEDGTLTVDALLFPLRGEYTVDVTVLDTLGKQQTKEFTITAAEPFRQSTFNGLVFLGALLVFGFIVGIIFGKNLFASKRAIGSMNSIFLFVLALCLLAPFVLAHSAEEMEETDIVHHEDNQIIFYTTPGVPDIGKETTFTFEVFDESGNRINNAVAQVELANEEEGFVVLELELFSQTGIFSFEYGIFDGAPHLATILVKPTKESSVAFAPIDREFAFAGTAHNPPFSAKLIATVVMLFTMVLGFALGVVVRTLPKKKQEKKGDSSQGGSHE